MAGTHFGCEQKASDCLVFYCDSDSDMNWLELDFLKSVPRKIVEYWHCKKKEKILIAVPFLILVAAHLGPTAISLGGLFTFFGFVLYFHWLNKKRLEKLDREIELYVILYPIAEVQRVRVIEKLKDRFRAFDSIVV